MYLFGHVTYFFFKFPSQLCAIKSELGIPFLKKIKASSHVFATLNKEKKKNEKYVALLSEQRLPNPD